MPKIGDRKLIARWLIEIGGDEINGVDPDKCKYGETEIKGSLESALNYANAWDLNKEGHVIEEEWGGEVWHEVERYNCYGERLFNH